MPTKIGEHYESNGVKVTYWDQGDGNVTVERSQDAQWALDVVSATNLDGAPTIDGLGKPVMEVPVVEAMAWCERRGIPWEKLLYSNEYDTEFKRFAQDYSRLCYESRKSVHTVQ